MNDAPSSLLALFGGTFDPIHYGHLKPVEALARQIALRHVVIMPNNVPPHRPQPQASSEQRKIMVSLAIARNPLFQLDCRELQRTSPSFTADTLEEIRQETGPRRPLAFIIGQDSLLTLPRWHRYQRISELCHLLVCRRPGYPVKMDSAAHQHWLDSRLTRNIADLHQQPGGKIFLADTPLFDISATTIRKRLEQAQSCADLLPPAVMQYIIDQGLYR
ncbi:nicotinate-nucleotide adenylyltransferase [Shimwellia blattae]|uniref:Probable nicotinate-nucleotide adenylyltransferase n=1 Tax=Shimwellia blattae (strain ATCC 29907 / DSM 4481 / JCM 1650 / NBRC 105725 / CDC 9005-74) TaxID=630626 RepID=I2BB92_SHIBC|nr:nicotinate-nucleotide adenylyltransferase [Shimwellia blattae]AFJ47796.1 nicotinate-nucleotide adenylyltransferase [Shimwellia blattae DSM 4481 = NBRC 105725]GAB79628.1 putative nicotinate-nucleotide adenylyltransferase [Shimwellia blattae DSM 4481 = NBRC 105725]VDY65297.1 Nicotinate-nucleotide adenylyltransferase [Shimwellia blattae]VEC24160.1 Nicotinate-nucleotide adenylyltransferase [Shimwellia blattae]